VAPGRIETPRVEQIYSDAESEAAAKRFPLGHAGHRKTWPKASPICRRRSQTHGRANDSVNGERIMT
ncbi:MAG: hypothetical protein ACREO5_01665, partial [Candidatus Binatia bacterium]